MRLLSHQNLNKMKTENFLKYASLGFIGLSSLSLLSVSLMAFNNPQAVMDLVSVKLENTDAYSSIRGIYGGAGMTIVLSLLFLMRKNIDYALGFLTMLWGFYVLSRTITIFAEGALGAFGNQWIIIESLFFVIALSLLIARNKNKSLI